MEDTIQTHKPAFSATPEQVEEFLNDIEEAERRALETELAYLEPEAMANPEDYERVKAELEAELAALKVQVGG